MSRWRCRWRAVAVALVLGGLALPASASADEQPAILKAYDLDWIERVRDDAWPQPKQQRPVICLLDTGVNVTPDTPDDNPAGPIVARLALDGGTGLAQGTSWEHLHGTEMASIIAAPRNGYGTVGVFPQARIVSIRVTDRRSEEVFISPAAVLLGVQRCARWSITEGATVASVVVPEANYDYRESDTEHWRSALAVTDQLNAMFVAAAGNTAGARALGPAEAPGVVVVSAGDSNGNACGFAAGLDQAAALRAPGCEARGWSDGSSAATAVTGALAAAYALARGSGNPREQVRSSARAAPGSAGLVSGTGLRAELAAYVSAVPPQVVPPAVLSMPVEVEGHPNESRAETRLWKPVVSVRWSKGRLVVHRTKGLGGLLIVRMVRKGVAQKFARAGRRVSLHVPYRPRTVEIWAEARDGSWRTLSIRCRVE